MTTTRKMTATRLPPKLAAADLASAGYWLPVLKEHNDRFEGSLRSSLSHAIELGKQLIAAKEALPHGEFGKLFSDHKERVEGALGMTQNWANKVMRIAANQAISNCEYNHNLPANLDAVYDLACMTAPALEAAIEEGKVRPDMTRAEAKALKQEAAPKQSAKRDLPAVPKDELRYDLNHSYGQWCARIESHTRTLLEDIPESKGLVKDYLLYMIERLCK